MATRAYVLRIDSVDTTAPGQALLTVSGSYCHDDNPGAPPFTVSVLFAWSDTANQIGAKLRAAILADAAASGYEVQTIISSQFAKL